MSWWRRRKERKLARAAMHGLFDRAEILARSSLRADHRARADLREYEIVDGEVRVVYFTVVRHPRPYAFSRQFHDVVELYRYDLVAGDVVVHDSVNLTRLRGLDGEGRI